MAKTSERVAELAAEFYLPIANHASLVSGVLDEHDRGREDRLIVFWDDQGYLETELDAWAEDRARRLEPNFIRLVVLFNHFNFDRGAGYLLPEYWATEALRKLYNQFIDATTQIDVWAVLKAFNETKGEESISDRVVATVEKVGSKRGSEPDALLAALTLWLRDQPNEVRRAARSLHALSKLLEHELSLLYVSWFPKLDRDMPSSAEQPLGERAVTAVQLLRLDEAHLRSASAGRPESVDDSEGEPVKASSEGRTSTSSPAAGGAKSSGAQEQHKRPVEAAVRGSSTGGEQGRVPQQQGADAGQEENPA